MVLYLPDQELIRAGVLMDSWPDKWPTSDSNNCLCRSYSYTIWINLQWCSEYPSWEVVQRLTHLKVNNEKSIIKVTLHAPWTQC